MDKSFTPLEVAQMLKIAKTTVYELIKRGELNSYRVGNKMRIELKDIENYIESKKEIKTKSTTEQIIKTNNNNSNEFIICGQDIILDILSRYIETYNLGIRIYRSYIGSYNGLYSMYINDAHAATTHLWDAETNSYNLTYIKNLLPGISTNIIHLAKRIQGFYVLKGNPKQIKTWQDLTKPNVTFINREKGSGTRVLLDEHLKKRGIDSSNIVGYSRECLSHLAGAVTIAKGGADVAMGILNPSTQIKSIEFIPIQEERFELVIKKEHFDTKVVEVIINILNSENFKLEVIGLGGYDVTEMGNVIA